MKKSIAALCGLVSILLVLPAFGGLLYQYSRLALKDLDQMNKLVQDKIQESRRSKGDQLVPLKEALQAVYSRPNEDFMIEKIIGPLKNELDEHDAYEGALKALVAEASGALKNPKAFGAVAQVTYAIFLENLVAEMQPRANQDFERGLLTSIKDAKIEISKQARNERSLRMMKEVKSPSDVAEAALKASAEAEKKKDQK